MGEECLQKRAQHTALWNSCVYGYCPECVIPNSDSLGSARQKVQNPVTEGVWHTKGIKLAY